MVSCPRNHLDRTHKRSPVNGGWRTLSVAFDVLRQADHRHDVALKRYDEVSAGCRRDRHTVDQAPDQLALLTGLACSWTIPKPGNLRAVDLSKIRREPCCWRHSGFDLSLEHRFLVLQVGQLVTCPPRSGPPEVRLRCEHGRNWNGAQAS